MKHKIENENKQQWPTVRGVDHALFGLKYSGFFVAFLQIPDTYSEHEARGSERALKR